MIEIELSVGTMSPAFAAYAAQHVSSELIELSDVGTARFACPTHEAALALIELLYPPCCTEVAFIIVDATAGVN